MSSKAFAARTGAGLCGLCESAFSAGERAFYLTCRTARGEQIESDRRTFRTVRTGSRTVAAGTRFEREVAVYGWQERRGGRWVEVEVWEQMCHVACAASRGYRIPAGETVAKYGTRTEGHAHRVAQMAQAVANVATVAATITATPETVGAAITQAEATGEAFNPYKSLLPPPAAPKVEAVANDGVRKIELDESKPTTRDANDLSDVSHIVERFKRLDLD